MVKKIRGIPLRLESDEFCARAILKEDDRGKAILYLIRHVAVAVGSEFRPDLPENSSALLRSWAPACDRACTHSAQKSTSTGWDGLNQTVLSKFDP